MAVVWTRFWVEWVVTWSVCMWTTKVHMLHFFGVH